eukprot:jgi/Tetstr1/439937/TSEL_028344.t1
MLRPQRASAVIHDDELPLRGRSPAAVFALYCLFCLALVCGLHGMHFAMGHDPLAHPLVVGKYVSIDSWSFVHVACFTGVGFLYPEQPVTYFIYGGLWEAIEYALTYTTPSLKAFWTERGVNSVWDLWFNLAGYRLGEHMLVRYVVWNRERKAAEARRAKRATAKRK